MGESEYIMVEQPGYMGVPDSQVPPTYRNGGKSLKVLAPHIYGPTAAVWRGNVLGAKAVFEKNAAEVARLGALAAQAAEDASIEHAASAPQPEAVAVQSQSGGAEALK